MTLRHGERTYGPHARKDKLRIITDRSKTGVYAALRRERDDEDPMAFSPESEQWLHTVYPAHESAQSLGHHWILGRDGQEAVVVCKRCEARGYINAPCSRQGPVRASML